jgi:hypothetical protein
MMIGALALALVVIAIPLLITFLASRSNDEDFFVNQPPATPPPTEEPTTTEPATTTTLARFTEFGTWSGTVTAEGNAARDLGTSTQTYRVTQTFELEENEGTVDIDYFEETVSKPDTVTPPASGCVPVRTTKTADASVPFEVVQSGHTSDLRWNLRLEPVGAQPITLTVVTETAGGGPGCGISETTEDLTVEGLVVQSEPFHDDGTSFRADFDADDLTGSNQIASFQGISFDPNFRCDQDGCATLTWNLTRDQPATGGFGRPTTTTSTSTTSTTTP